MKSRKTLRHEEKHATVNFRNNEEEGEEGSIKNNNNDLILSNKDRHTVIANSNNPMQFRISTLVKPKCTR
jgi:hypothetical protein